MTEKRLKNPVFGAKRGEDAGSAQKSYPQQKSYPFKPEK
jgi:hypothetical protein